MDILACNGVGRDAEDDRSIAVHFTRPLSDDELRRFHDYCRDAARNLDALEAGTESKAARFAREVREGTARFVMPDGTPTGPDRER